jgi:hypothetical protein
VFASLATRWEGEIELVPDSTLLDTAERIEAALRCVSLVNQSIRTGSIESGSILLSVFANVLAQRLVFNAGSPYLIKSVFVCDHNELTFVTRGRSNSVNRVHHCSGLRKRRRAVFLPAISVSPYQKLAIAAFAACNRINQSTSSQQASVSIGHPQGLYALLLLGAEPQVRNLSARTF